MRIIRATGLGLGAAMAEGPRGYISEFASATSDEAVHSPPRARSRRRFALPLMHLIPDSLRQSTPLCLRRRRGRAPGALGAGDGAEGGHDDRPDLRRRRQGKVAPAVCCFKDPPSHRPVWFT